MKKRLLGMNKVFLEVKIGIFSLGAIFLVFVAAVSIKDISFVKGGYIIKVNFTFAEGITPASPVRFCGVNIGEVKKVEIDEYNSNPTVCVYAKIRKGAQIPCGSHIFINSLSVFGEKYVEIIPPDKIEDFLQGGDVVEGISSVPLASIMASFHETMTGLDAFIDEAELKDSLKDIVANVKEATGNMSSIIEAIKSSDGTLGRFIYDESLYEKTEAFVDDVTKHPWKLLYKPKEKKRR